MAKTKWRCREYTPSANQSGSHSFYAEAVINSDLTNEDLASRIQARTGFKSYEVQAVIAAIADNADYIEFNECAFRHMQDYGMLLYGDNNKVYGCEFIDIGARAPRW